MLAAASLLAERGHDVTVLVSGETREAVSALGLDVVGYRRSPDPDASVAFEEQAEAMMARAAGEEIALDVRDALAELRPDLAVADCMLPAALAAARATGTPAASIVHFPYGLARPRMAASGDGWTTDLRTLAETHRALGLEPPRDGLDAWESPELVLVTAPSWFDLEYEAPARVVHAGPLGVRATPATGERRRVLLSFSTTVMEGQPEVIERACEAVAGLGVEAVVTLGPAVARSAVRVPAGVEVLASGDHDLLMAESVAVVGHGGLGTVLRALAHGVPQLMLPLGRDQGFNAGRVTQLGAGMRRPADASPVRIGTALQRLLDDRGFAEAARRAAARIAADEPDRAAAEALERTAAA
jgi:UDP:flavonoid glycosyltransferase YjiC (YdhE family)